MIVSQKRQFRLLLILVLVEVIAVAGLFTVHRAGEGEYVRGKFGEKCYHIGSEHGNIKYPIFYPSLDDCLKSL